MKKKYYILVLVAVFLALPAMVQAQEDQTDPVRLEREKRVSQRVSQLKPDLSAEQISSYKSRCVDAQAKVSKHLATAKLFSENHDKKYDEFLDKTNKLIDRLEPNGKNVVVARAAIENAIKQKSEIKAAYEKYILALSDTAKIDCQADPQGFRASIDEAKQDFRQLRQLRQDLREKVKQDLRTALQSIKDAN